MAAFKCFCQRCGRSMLDHAHWVWLLCLCTLYTHCESLGSGLWLCPLPGSLFCPGSGLLNFPIDFNESALCKMKMALSSQKMKLQAYTYRNQAQHNPRHPQQLSRCPVLLLWCPLQSSNTNMHSPRRMPLQNWHSRPWMQFLRDPNLDWAQSQLSTEGVLWCDDVIGSVIASLAMFAHLNRSSGYFPKLSQRFSEWTQITDDFS